MLEIILIAISLNIDALGVGFAYGIRKIFVSNIAKIIISSLSMIMTFLAIVIGSQLKNILPYEINKIIGVLILFIMGFCLIIQSIKKSINKNKIEKNKSEKKNKKADKKIIIKSLNLTIKIIHEPQLADVNNSKKIELPEAICIGFALSTDSLINGIGFSVLGYNNLLLSLVTAICQYIFLSTGLFFGRKINKKNPDKNKFILISGLILISIAIFRFLF